MKFDKDFYSKAKKIEAIVKENDFQHFADLARYLRKNEIAELQSFAKENTMYCVKIVRSHWHKQKEWKESGNLPPVKAEG